MAEREVTPKKNLDAVRRMESWLWDRLPEKGRDRDRAWIWNWDATWDRMVEVWRQMGRTAEGGIDDGE